MDDGMCQEVFLTPGRYDGNDRHLCWEEEGHEGRHYALLEVGPGWRIKAEWETEDQ